MPYVLQHLDRHQSRLDYVPLDVLSIGRGTQAGLRLDDPTVALDHAAIEAGDGGHRLIDHGGITGTYLNGSPVQEAPLHDGDLIQIGGAEIRVQITDPGGPLFLAIGGAGAAREDADSTVLAAPRDREQVRALIAEIVGRRQEAPTAGPNVPGDPRPGSSSGERQTAPSGDRKVATATLARALLQGRPSSGAPPAPAASTVAAPPGAPPAITPAGPPPEPPANPIDIPAGLPMVQRGASPAGTLRVPIGDLRGDGAAGDGLASVDPLQPAAGGSPAGTLRVTLDSLRAEATAEALPEAGLAAATAPSRSPAPPVGPAPPVSPAPPASPAPPDSLPARPAALPPQPAGAGRAGQLRAPKIDYLKAYGLRRAFFSKTLLSLGLAAAAAAAMLALPYTGRSMAFEPGGVHRWHAAVTTCDSCHAPWRGPQASLCADCHSTQRLKGEPHQARQTTPPACTTCHPEHRGGERLAFVDDRSCASCHADLRVIAGAPRFAAAIRGWNGGHPEFSITLPGGDRLWLADAVAQRADPTPLRFNHRQHLRPGLPTPDGPRVQLTCENCHRLAESGVSGVGGVGGVGAASGGETGMVPVTYRVSCTSSGCHPLTFDDRRPKDIAPHDTPQRVRQFLVSAYSDRRAREESVGRQFRLLVRGQGSATQGLDFGAQAQRGVILAERYLYGTACKECHLIDPNATPYPVVTWIPIPQRWLPNSHFSHLDHRTTPCLQCHAAAPASTAAADVLLPGIAVCQRCHGGPVSGGGSGVPLAGSAPRPARSDCISCHDYHPTPAGAASPAETS